MWSSRPAPLVERRGAATELRQALLQVQGYFIWHGHT
jgi:hypothetical protein